MKTVYIYKKELSSLVFEIWITQLSKHHFLFVVQIHVSLPIRKSSIIIIQGYIISIKLNILLQIPKILDQWIINIYL